MNSDQLLLESLRVIKSLVTTEKGYPKAGMEEGQAFMDRLEKFELLKWTKCFPNPFTGEMEGAYPTEPGKYRVRYSGDSETDGPHVYYDYPDYDGWGRFWADEDGEIRFAGEQDQEIEEVIAWYGPIKIPRCDCFDKED